MKRLIIWLAVLVVLIVVAWSASIPAMQYIKERRRINYRQVDVTRGKIVAVVNSTGTVKPVRSVLVGAFVSGPIKQILVDFNDPVKKGQLLAKIDPTLYEANVARDKALLATNKAQVERAKSQLQQAINDKARAKKLRTVNPTFISDTEMDQFKFNKLVMEAQLEVAVTSIDQAQANLENSLANLGYTNILAPEDGVVIDRKIDPGQTVAATFQTPDLFVVAPDMRRVMLVFASVDETDVGLIREAKDTGQVVRFTVDSYPDELFAGTISQIRQSSTTTQNVVTYPVIVAVTNPHLLRLIPTTVGLLGDAQGLGALSAAAAAYPGRADFRLMPGMTANISFQLREKANALRVPNAALRFFPQRDLVRPEDRGLLESKAPTPGELDEQTDKTRSAQEKADLRKQRHRRVLWVMDGDYLRAVPVVTGLSDNSFTEIVSGDVGEGQKIVTGVQAK